MMINGFSALFSCLSAIWLFQALPLPTWGCWLVTCAAAVICFFIVRYACTKRDPDIQKTAFFCAFVPAVLQILCNPIVVHGAYPAFSLMGLVKTIALFAMVHIFSFSLLVCFYSAMNRRHPDRANDEGFFRKLIGNGFFAFFLLLLCWTPVWLAFYPGHFLPDNVTQFCEVFDEYYTTHHPLLHTLLYGALMNLGIEWTSEEGIATLGVALYSVVQMILMAAILAYGCSWLKKRRVPLGIRTCVLLFFALFPCFPLWSFSPQKDILFSGVVLLLSLSMIDLWQSDLEKLKKPWFILRFMLYAVLMMMLRNNGVYALVLLIPFVMWLAKGKRIRILSLFAGCIALYFLLNGALIHVMQAESGSRVEMFSVPLQQIARSLRDHPEDQPSPQEQEWMDSLFPEQLVPYYTPHSADPVKWVTDYDVLDETTPQLLTYWIKTVFHHPITCTEAFVAQNAPYLVVNAPLAYRIVLGIEPFDYYTIESKPVLPWLRRPYEQYDQNLTFFHIPFVPLLSHPAFYLYLCVALIGLAVMRKEKQWLPSLILLLCLFATCLLGPLALIRYVLAFYYVLPVLLAGMTAPSVSAASDKP